MPSALVVACNKLWHILIPPQKYDPSESIPPQLSFQIPLQCQSRNYPPTPAPNSHRFPPSPFFRTSQPSAASPVYKYVSPLPLSLSKTNCRFLSRRVSNQMDAYALHLAMAALVGASFVAVSAFYMHRKTLTQLLEFARSIEERERERDRDRDRSRRKKSPPDAAAAEAEEENGETGGGELEKFPMSNGHLIDLGIPAGLPRLHTVPEGNNYVLDRFLSELVME